MSWVRCAPSSATWTKKRRRQGGATGRGVWCSSGRFRWVLAHGENQRDIHGRMMGEWWVNDGWIVGWMDFPLPVNDDSEWSMGLLLSVDSEEWEMNGYTLRSSNVAVGNPYNFVCFRLGGASGSVNISHHSSPLITESQAWRSDAFFICSTSSPRCCLLQMPDFVSPLRPSARRWRTWIPWCGSRVCHTYLGTNWNMKNMKGVKLGPNGLNMIEYHWIVPSGYD